MDDLTNCQLQLHAGPRAHLAGKVRHRLIVHDNNNFRVNRAQTISQNPIFRLEEHVSHNPTDVHWLSADAYYNVTGETSIDGTGQDNMANTLGAGMGLRLGVVQTLLLTMSVCGQALRRAGRANSTFHRQAAVVKYM